jgi:ClpP class serine protease
MQDRIIDFITRNSRIPEAELRRLMMNTEELVLDVGTVVDGERAVKLGLIDKLGSLGDAMDCLYGMIEATEPRYPDKEENK